MIIFDNLIEVSVRGEGSLYFEQQRYDVTESSAYLKTLRK